MNEDPTTAPLPFDLTGPWRRLYAIGDVHGDLDALVRIFRGLEVIDDAGNWSAPETLLVMLGDLNDRGFDSVNVMGWIMDLQPQAEALGSRLVPLLGNHEVLGALGEYFYIHPREGQELKDFSHGQYRGVEAVFRGESPYARWLRTRSTVVKANDHLFIHAGLGPWALEADTQWINATMRQWVTYCQGLGDRPQEGSLWLIAPNFPGPVWTSQFRVVPEDQVDRQALAVAVEALEQALARWGARRLVVGHRPTDQMDFHIAHPHPFYGTSVGLLATGICRFYEGRLSALEIDGDVLTPHYFPRGDRETPLTEALRHGQQLRRQAMSDPASPADVDNP
ncbi:MAG: metallophosphoesterase [Candidatus Competibacterales bacterium]